jgi:hypothetical protein
MGLTVGVAIALTFMTIGVTLICIGLFRLKQLESPRTGCPDHPRERNPWCTTCLKGVTGK